MALRFFRAEKNAMDTLKSVYEKTVKLAEA